MKSEKQTAEEIYKIRKAMEEAEQLIVNLKADAFVLGTNKDCPQKDAYGTLNRRLGALYRLQGAVAEAMLDLEIDWAKTK